jgi:hypothetical protein
MAAAELPFVLLEQDGLESRELGGRVVEDGEEGLAVCCLEGDRGVIRAPRGFELVCEGDVVGVAKSACEVEDGAVGDVYAGKEHCDERTRALA